MEEPTEGAIQGEIVSILITGRHGVTKELEELRGKTEIIPIQFLGKKITLIRPCISLSMKEKSGFYEKLSSSSVLINRPKIDFRGGILQFKNMKQQLTLTLFSLSLVAFLATPGAKADIFDALVYCRVTGIRTGQLALRHQPNGAAHSALGVALFITGKSGEALEAFNQAILKSKPSEQLSTSPQLLQLSPQLSLTSLLGSLLMADGQRDSVISTIDKAIEIDSGNVLAYLGLIGNLNSLDRTLESKQILNHFHANYSEIPEVYLILLLTEIAEISKEKTTTISSI